MANRASVNYFTSHHSSHWQCGRNQGRKLVISNSHRVVNKKSIYLEYLELVAKAVNNDQMPADEADNSSTSQTSPPIWSESVDGTNWTAFDSDFLFAHLCTSLPCHKIALHRLVSVQMRPFSSGPPTRAREESKSTTNQLVQKVC